MPNQPQRLFLIDGSSYIYRAYYAIRHLSNSQGMATNAIYGFTNMLLKVIRESQPDQLAVIYDSKGPTFRKNIYPEYKANRSAMPEDLVPQIPYIKRVVEAFNLPGIEKAGYEADDIIATLAGKFAAEGIEVVVVTGDKDLMQIVNDRVCLLDTMKDKIYGPAEVFERFGGADKVVEVQALAGDSSDNVPGVPGIGEKTAKALIDEFGDVETLLASLDQLKGKRRENLENFADQARLSKQLVTLITNLDLDVDDNAFVMEEPNRQALTELFKECEFHKLLQEFSDDSRASAKEADYRAVLNETDLAEMVAALEASERFAFDTETTGLDPLRADLVGLSFSVTPGEAWYVPVSHRYLGVPEQLPLDKVLAAVGPLLGSDEHLKVGQNLKYDILVMGRVGVAVTEPLFDTMLASYLANSAAQSHGMDSLATELLDYRTIPYSDVAGSGKKKICFDEVEVEKATVYAAEDADITLRLYEKLLPMVAEQDGCRAGTARAF
jgi:DNA polymerase-1